MGSVQACTHVSREELTALDAAAARAGRSRSSQLRQYLMAGLEAAGRPCACVVRFAGQHGSPIGVDQSRCPLHGEGAG